MNSILAYYRNHYRYFLEFAAVFAVFYIAANWAVPDSNEAHYIGKAIHYWNPDYIPHDDFLNSKDSHLAFYFTFGWLSFFFAQEAMAYIGRFAVWLLLAFSWQRFSFTLVPIRYASIASAVAMAYYVNSFNMAGEWFLGGVEAKCFAFPLMFLGIDSMLRGKWNRCWLLLGAASAFHVLTGGWAVLACLFVRIFEKKNGRFVLPQIGEIAALIIGGGLSLFGLIPALLLDVGTPKDIILQARQIYVFDRLYHHLSPAQLPWTFPARFALLTILWFAAFRFSNKLQRHKRFNRFVYAALLLAMFGLAVSFGLQSNKVLAAEILRFYWFRLSDLAVPMGVALGATWAFLKILRQLKTDITNILPSAVCRLLSAFMVFIFFDYLIFGLFFFSWRTPELGIPWLLTLLFCFVLVKSGTMPKHKPLALFLIYTAVLFYAPFLSLKHWADLRTRFSYSRIESDYPETAYYWRDVCGWIADEENTPPDAKFWVPREAATFKWFAKRSDTGLWKDVPQDAASIVKWHETMKELFDIDKPELRDRSLTVNLWWKNDEDIERLQKKYRFDYIVCTSYPDLPQLQSLKTVYENKSFRVYKVEIKTP
ncbi:MAG: hypothetical protein FWE67_13210 [Planctomycetaceae bacterium]|nr:hypothetical protein [Planctomycetaceae bacterium]